MAKSLAKLQTMNTFELQVDEEDYYKHRTHLQCQNNFRTTLDCMRIGVSLSRRT